MRRVVLLLVGAMLLLFTAALPAIGSPPNPLVGSWQNVDVLDGSDQHLSIAPGAGHFHYRDNAATGCDTAGFGFVPASLSGFGEFGDESLSFAADIYCHVRGPGGRQLLGPVSLTFTYDAVSDTLTDSLGQRVWQPGGLLVRHPLCCLSTHRSD